MNETEPKRPYSGLDAFVVTGFGSGLSPFAPGTMGAVVAVALWLIGAWLMPHWPLQALTLALILAFTFASVPMIRRVEQAWGEDPSRVVIDEVVGTWICLLAVPPSHHWGYVLGAFALFRFFDILKPLGVRRMEAIGRGWGVMLDDILAGIYGFLVLLIVQIVI